MEAQQCRNQCELDNNSLINPSLCNNIPHSLIQIYLSSYKSVYLYQFRLTNQQSLIQSQRPKLTGDEGAFDNQINNSHHNTQAKIQSSDIIAPEALVECP